jgi:hypothetical protein
MHLSGHSASAAVTKAPLVREALRTPRAAAVAGIIFSLLLISCLWLLQLSVPSDPLDVGAWLKVSSKRVSLALNLVPFAGIAFMWFLGVLRDRLGLMEDKFFATRHGILPILADRAGVRVPDPPETHGAFQARDPVDPTHIEGQAAVHLA